MIGPTTNEIIQEAIELGFHMVAIIKETSAEQARVLTLIQQSRDSFAKLATHTDGVERMSAKQTVNAFDALILQIRSGDA